MDFENNNFIFYLSLEETLPKNYYLMDEKLKDFGYMLMPIKVDQLQSIISASMQEHIMILCSVTNASEYKQYNSYVRKFLKNTLKSKRSSFFLFSSFSKINDKKNLYGQDNYYFLKYPICLETLILHLNDFFIAKSSNSSLWPGGRRAIMEEM